MINILISISLFATCTLYSMNHLVPETKDFKTVLKAHNYKDARAQVEQNPKLILDVVVLRMMEYYCHGANAPQESLEFLKFILEKGKQFPTFQEIVQVIYTLSKERNVQNYPNKEKVLRAFEDVYPGLNNTNQASNDATDKRSASERKTDTLADTGQPSSDKKPDSGDKNRTAGSEKQLASDRKADALSGSNTTGQSSSDKKPDSGDKKSTDGSDKQATSGKKAKLTGKKTKEDTQISKSSWLKYIIGAPIAITLVCLVYRFGKQKDNGPEAKIEKPV